MWKKKKKQKEAEAVEETVDAETEKPASSEVEQAVSVETEKISSAKEEEVPSTEEEKTVSTTVEKASLEKMEEKVEVNAGNTDAVENVSPSGVFIFGSRIESRFKKFMTAIFSIFLLPPAIVFGLSVITVVVLIAFPLVSIILPITLLSLCILFILLPVVLPFLTVVSLITGKGKVQFGLENKKFAIRVLGITIPPYAGR
ncbi:MAG: hypothetical protein R2568_05945 [Candidatus Scalindua sp.]|jgi:hypothetical protein|nr:hypothetical protein [Candidatus Scalindua sp.]MDV5166274.1 hypothetical protein [Candidatus Scalindua sp.]